MRRIVMYNRVTMDGYFAGTDGNLNWVVPDTELDRSAAQNIDHGARGAMLFGRRTYEMFASYWPHALDDAAGAEDPHHAGRRSPEITAMATWINAAEKIVFSRTLTEATWAHTRIVPELDPAAVAALKHDGDGDIMLFGSGSIVSRLTEHGLIDEYRFVVSPLFLGDGQRLLHDVSKLVALTLLESTATAAGNVTLRYAPKSG